MKHTPAPWHVEKSDTVENGYYIHSSDEHWSPIVSTWGGNKHATKANSYLIAAAPELLEALEGLVNDFDEQNSIFNETVDIARDAINKAKGL